MPKLRSNLSPMILMYKKEGSPSGLGHYLDSTLYALTVTKMKFLFTFVIM